MMMMMMMMMMIMLCANVLRRGAGRGPTARGIHLQLLRVNPQHTHRSYSPQCRYQILQADRGTVTLQCEEGCNGVV